VNVSAAAHAKGHRATLRDLESASRTPEIEDVTNARFIHPLSRRLTLLLAHWGVAPNAVSLAGMACGLLAGVAYFHYAAWWGPVLGAALMVAWHILDGSDGQLARLTHRQSELGKVIDGCCDYVTFIAVYVGLGLAMAHQMGPWVWALLLLAGLAHAVQAAAYEVQRQAYDVSVHGKRAAELPKLEDLRAQAGSGLLQRLHVVYVRMQYLADGTAATRRERLAAALARHPQQQAQIRARYRDLFAPQVRAWSLLSSNYRTIAIFVAAVFAVPWLYFVWVFAGLSLLMAWRVQAQRRCWVAYARFLDELDAVQSDGARLAGD
jgi:phosphatidylglycerophosphate synthase